MSVKVWRNGQWKKVAGWGSRVFVGPFNAGGGVGNFSPADQVNNLFFFNPPGYTGPTNPAEAGREVYYCSDTRDLYIWTAATGWRLVSSYAATGRVKLAYDQQIASTNTNVVVNWPQNQPGNQWVTIGQGWPIGVEYLDGVEFTGGDGNTDNGYDPTVTTNRLRVLFPGVYRITAQVLFGNANGPMPPVGTRRVGVRRFLNAVDPAPIELLHEARTPSYDNTPQQRNTVVNLNGEFALDAGSELDLVVAQNSGIVIPLGVTHTFMSITRVRPVPIWSSTGTL